MRDGLLALVAAAAFIWSAFGDSWAVMRVDPPWPTPKPETSFAKLGLEVRARRVAPPTRARSPPTSRGRARARLDHHGQGAHIKTMDIKFDSALCTKDCTKLRDAAKLAKVSLFVSAALMVIAFVCAGVQGVSSALPAAHQMHGSMKAPEPRRLRALITVSTVGIVVVVLGVGYFAVVCAVGAHKLESSGFNPAMPFVPPGAFGGLPKKQHHARPGFHALVFLVGLAAAIVGTVRAVALQREARQTGEEAIAFIPARGAQVAV